MKKLMLALACAMALSSAMPVLAGRRNAARGKSPARTASARVAVSQIEPASQDENLVQDHVAQNAPQQPIQVQEDELEPGNNCAMFSGAYKACGRIWRGLVYALALYGARQAVHNYGVTNSPQLNPTLTPVNVSDVCRNEHPSYLDWGNFGYSRCVQWTAECQKNALGKLYCRKKD